MDSLMHVCLHKASHQLPVQRYDIAGEDGSFSERYWKASNKPVFSPEGEVAYIIHSAEDITAKVKAEKREVQMDGIEQAFGLFMHAPMVVGMVDGDDHVLKMANEEAFKLWGKGPEIIGKPILQSLPELKEQGIIDLFDQVRNSGRPYIAHEVQVNSFVDGKEEQHYFNLVYQPYYSEGRLQPTGVFTISHDVTEQVEARLKVEKSEATLKQFKFMADNAQDPFILMREDGTFAYLNSKALEAWGYTEEEARSIRVPDADPIYNDAAYKELFRKAREQTIPQFETLHKRKDGSFFPVEVKVNGLRLDGMQYLFAVARNITERRASEQLLKNNQALLRTVFDASPNSLTVYEEVYNKEGKIEDFKFVIVNHFTIRTTGREDLVGKLYTVEFPHVKDTGVLDKFIEVATTGIPADFEKWYEGDGMRHWFRFIVNKIGKLLVVTTEDISKRKEAENAIQESEAKLRSILNSAPTAMGVFVGPDLIIENPNQFMIDVLAAGPDIEGKSFRELLSGLVDEDRKFLDLVDDVRTTGMPYVAQEAPVFFKSDKKARYFNISFIPLLDDKGDVYAVLDVSVDVTGQVLARQKLEEKESDLANALEQVRLSKEAAELGTFDMNMETGYMHWDDRCRTLFGISHQQPVSFEQDFIQRLHPDDRERISEELNRTFNKSLSNGEYDVAYRTIGAEDGIIRWVRAKGKVYFRSNDQPVRFIGSVLDITEQKMAIQKIEGLVEERTKELAKANNSLQKINKELQRSNQNLEEFAHAASHDLKEPVRKIQFFTHQLRDQLSTLINETQARSFSRIENATERMGNLIDDLLLYSHVSQRPHESEAVDLNDKVQRVLEDLELDIEEKGALIKVDKLPVVKGYRRQLQQLFQNLVSNALKYTRKDVIPHIDIIASEVTENERRYHLIAVKDNGIGFEPEYAEKIFQMFTRLHGKAEYSGTGVGLSIVKKVVENHNGMIRVESVVGEGSVFKIYLPV
jgi:hypothetical protein